MKKLENPHYSISDIRSLSSKILKSEAVTDLLNKINEEYLYWDKVKYQPLPEGINHKQLWALVKLRRITTPYSVQFGKYKFQWNVNSKLQGYLHFLDLNIGGSLESSSIISKEDKNRYLLSSIMEEAIASSQIEGAATTRKKAKEMLRKNKKPSNKSEFMIFNNYVTIQKILEIKKEPITLERLLEVHRLITTNTLSSNKEEGFLREDDEVRVIDTVDGTVVHQPPPVEELEDLLKDLFKFFNEEESKIFVHPVIKACIVHFAIGFIHPFVDGNGRTGRALFYWFLLKQGYWLTEYLSISRLILRSKGAYEMAFIYTEVDDFDLTYFIGYNVRTMKLAFEELISYIKKKNDQKKQFTAFLGVDGITYRQALILEWFRGERNHLTTIEETSKRLGASYMSARSDLKGLVDKGYLSIKPINGVLKGYTISEKFDSLLAKVHQQ